MQHPAYAHVQQSSESQLPVPGSLQMQQHGHGQLYGQSPQETMLSAPFSDKRAYPQFNGPSNEHSQMEYMPSNNPYQASNMMQGPNVNGGQNYPQFNGHMTGHYPMQPTAYGSQPQTFLEPQSYSYMPNQMPGQTYPHQAGQQQQQQQPPPQNHVNISNQVPGQTYQHQAGKQQQQQIVPQQPQQPAQPGFEWIPVMPIDVNEMMMQVLLQHIVEYRTRFQQILQIEFPNSFAKCIRIRFKADYVINFSMACKLCHSHSITTGSETRKYHLTDKMEKTENLKMIVEWGTELWHFCQNCHAQWNVSVDSCHSCGEMSEFADRLDRYSVPYTAVISGSFRLRTWVKGLTLMLRTTINQRNS
jgi:hypothetical protein